MRSLILNDRELVLLDGQCRPDVQPEVDRAKARLVAAKHYDLPEAIAGLIADVVSEATEHGSIRYARVRTHHCLLCVKHAGYFLYKSGPRHGKPNYERPRTFEGIEFSDSGIYITNHISLGGCEKCVEQALPFIRDALITVRAEVPAVLTVAGRPAWKKYARRRCTECEWEGHEGQMGRSRTVLGDGTYASTCPNCGVQNRFLGPQLIEVMSGQYEVVDETPTISNGTLGDDL